MLLQDDDFFASQLLFSFTSTSIFGDAPYSIVFIHIGNSIPDFVPVALVQARTFNPACQIILVANERAKLSLHNLHAILPTMQTKIITTWKL